MPKKKVNEVLTIYSTCFKICKNCSNIQCNSCKKKTKAAFSNVSKVHYGLDISESEITLENLPSSHSGEKSNKCNQCDFASSYASALRAHLKTHSGEKPNKCNQCDYESLNAGNLKRHLKVHSGEKSNKCNKCDYASSRAGDLRKHLKTHSGKKVKQMKPM